MHSTSHFVVAHKPIVVQGDTNAHSTSLTQVTLCLSVVFCRGQTHTGIVHQKQQRPTRRLAGQRCIRLGPPAGMSACEMTCVRQTVMARLCVSACMLRMFAPDCGHVNAFACCVCVRECVCGGVLYVSACVYECARVYMCMHSVHVFVCTCTDIYTASRTHLRLDPHHCNV